MFSLILWIIVGLIFVFAAPIAIKSFLKEDSFIIPTVVRLFGLLLIVWSVLSTSYVYVADHAVGHIFKVYGGGPLKPGHIIATQGENGPQARVLPPGFRYETLINVFNDMDFYGEVVIPPGQIGVLNAVDGTELRPGQAFADAFPAKLGYQMLDAETFLSNGGQRGPQLTVLAPGTYRLNTYLWKVVPKSAEEIPIGFVGVVKSNVHDDVDFGTLRAEKPKDCEIIRATDLTVQKLAAPIVPVGCIGVWDKSLPPGKYYFNPDAFAITDVDTRAQVWSYAGGYTRSKIDLTVNAKGDIEQTRTQTTVEFDPKSSADQAVFVKMEGWDVPLELRVVAQVSPDQAACVVASVGGLEAVEDRVLTPSIRAITRDVAGGSYEVKEPKLSEDGKAVLDPEGKPTFTTVVRLTKVLDLINQRPLIEGEIERRIRPEAEKACVTIREVRLGEPAIPPELLVAVRREQLATQLAKAFIQEQASQEKRIDSEKAKATADQQDTLVKSLIGVQTSEQNAIAARNEGQGARDKLSLIAEGQKMQQNVLGTDATVDLRKFELSMDRVFGFIDKHPEVLTAALSNPQKFVPNTVVGGDGGSGGLIEALLGTFLTNQAAGLAPPKVPPPVTVSPPTGDLRQGSAR